MHPSVVCKRRLPFGMKIVQKERSEELLHFFSFRPGQDFMQRNSAQPEIDSSERQPKVRRTHLEQRSAFGERF